MECTRMQLDQIVLWCPIVFYMYIELQCHSSIIHFSICFTQLHEQNGIELNNTCRIIVLFLFSRITKCCIFSLNEHSAPCFLTPWAALCVMSTCSGKKAVVTSLSDHQGMYLFQFMWQNILSQTDISDANGFQGSPNAIKSEPRATRNWNSLMTFVHGDPQINSINRSPPWFHMGRRKLPKWHRIYTGKVQQQ